MTALRVLIGCETSGTFEGVAEAAADQWGGYAEERMKA